MDRLKETLMSMGMGEESIPEPSNFNTDSDKLRVKDADTVNFVDEENENVPIRLQGVNAAETGKLFPGDSREIKGSQPGADLQTELTRQTINEGGYFKPVLSGEQDDKGRELGDLSSGSQKLTNELLEKGYVDLGRSPSVEQQTYQTYGGIERIQRANELRPTVADAMYDKLVGEQYPEGRAIAKMYTTNAKQFNQADLDYFIGPGVIQQGENERGEATAFFAGVEGGWERTKQGVFNTLEMIGQTTGVEWLEQLGTRNVDMYQSNIEALPFLKNPEAFDENGEWQLDTLGKVFGFAIDQASSSAPQMMVSILSVLAAPATYGLSLGVPAAIYTGQTWGEQEEDNKNASAAILSGVTQAALDSLPISRVFRPGMNLANKSTQDLVKKELQDQLGVKDWVAEQMLTNSFKKEISKVSKAIRDVTIKQATGRKAIARDTLEGAVTESFTESLQELAGYMGENVTLSLPTDPEGINELKNRLANAATGGAILGGGFSGAATGYKTLTTRPGTSGISSDAEFREKFKSTNNTSVVPNTVEIQAEAQKLVQPDENSLDRLARVEESKRSAEGVPSKLMSWYQDKGISDLFGKRSDMILSKNQYADKFMATLGTLLGAGKAINGRSIDEHQQLLEANIFTSFGTKEELMSKFSGMNEREINAIFLDKNVKSSLLTLINEIDKSDGMTAAQVAEGLNLNFGKFNGNRDALVEYAGRIKSLVKNYNDATKNKMTAFDFLNRSPLNKAVISGNYKQFVKDLQDTFDIDNKEASDIAASVLTNTNVTSLEDSLDDLLNLSKVNYKNKDVLIEEMNLPENRDKFSRYLSNSILENAYTLATRGAAISTNKNLIGKNGSRLVALVEASEKNGTIDSSTASFMAKEIKDYIATREGRYNRIDNPYINGVLSTFNFMSTIVSLPLAAFSSTVEFSQVYRNLSREQGVKATRILLRSAVKEIGSALRDIGNGVTDKVDIKDSPHRNTLSRAGFIREGNMSQRLDVVSGYYQKWTEGFFKLTGLTSITTITRAARQGIAADAIKSWLDKVKDINGQPTQDQIDARDHLIRIGIDVDFMVGDMKPDERSRTRFENNMQQGVFNFINEAVVVPSALNRPKFYSNPYLRLFTQFQGYISTFTANILPRLIKDLGKRGSDDQKNAAAVIAMMFALSLLAIAIKDMIKYGESPPEWLDDDKEFQRIISQMGILGTGQRIWDTFDPLFDPQYRNQSVAGRAWQNISDQSPQLAFVNKIDKALSAPEGKEIQRAARVLPIFGTSPAFANLLQEELGDLTK